MSGADALVLLAVFLTVGLVFYLVISHHRLLQAHYTLAGRYDVVFVQLRELCQQREQVEASSPRIAPKVPPVMISRDVLHELAAGINRDRRAQPGVEHGFALVGRVDGDGDNRRIIVNGMIEAGAKAEKFAGEIRFDRDFQQRELEKLHLVDARASHIGDAHLHPGTLDRCSSGDLRTDRANVMASNTREMVFCIATIARLHHPSAALDSSSLYVDGLKLDFFYLGSASDFRYHKITPREIDEPALSLPATLRQLIDRRPERARFDWPNLVSLPQFKISVSKFNGLPCVELHHRADGWKAMVLLEESDDAPPHVYVEQGGQVEQFQPAFLDGKWSPHIWLTEIALAVDEQMSARKKAASVVPSALASRISAFADDVRIDPQTPFE